MGKCFFLLSRIFSDKRESMKNKYRSNRALSFSHNATTSSRTQYSQGESQKQGSLAKEDKYWYIFSVKLI